jgi:hypothetical protein
VRAVTVRISEVVSTATFAFAFASSFAFTFVLMTYGQGIVAQIFLILIL